MRAICPSICNLKSAIRNALLHEAAGIFPGSAAYGKAVNFQCGYTDADGHGLSVFAAGADAFVELKVVADHRHAGEDVRTVADQRGAFDRSGDLAVLDEIGLGGGEYEFPLVMSTCPPPKFTAYTPFLTDRMMSSGSSCPASM